MSCPLALKIISVEQTGEDGFIVVGSDDGQAIPSGQIIRISAIWPEARRINPSRFVSPRYPLVSRPLFLTCAGMSAGWFRWATFPQFGLIEWPDPDDIIMRSCPLPNVAAAHRDAAPARDPITRQFGHNLESDRIAAGAPSTRTRTYSCTTRPPSRGTGSQPNLPVYTSPLSHIAFPCVSSFPMPL